MRRAYHREDRPCQGALNERLQARVQQLATDNDGHEHRQREQEPAIVERPCDGDLVPDDALDKAHKILSGQARPEPRRRERALLRATAVKTTQ